MREDVDWSPYEDPAHDANATPDDHISYQVARTRRVLHDTFCFLCFWDKSLSFADRLQPFDFFTAFRNHYRAHLAAQLRAVDMFKLYQAAQVGEPPKKRRRKTTPVTCVPPLIYHEKGYLCPCPPCSMVFENRVDFCNHVTSIHCMPGKGADPTYTLTIMTGEDQLFDDDADLVKSLKIKPTKAVNAQYAGTTTFSANIFSRNDNYVAVRGSHEPDDEPDDEPDGNDRDASPKELIASDGNDSQ